MSPQWQETARCCVLCRAGTTWLSHHVMVRPDSHRVMIPCTALCRFDGPVQQAIYRLKFDARRDIARSLAGLLAARLGDLLAYDAIVPVPLAPARLRERGYNQSALLAHALMRHQRRSWRNGQAATSVQSWLRRVRATDPQVGKSAAARRTNVRSAFVCTAPRALVAGRRVLLIDDVLTTGATLAACASPLRRLGAQVEAAVIAVA